MSTAVIETVDELIDQIENLLDNNEENDVISDSTISCKSVSSTPIQSLCPSTKKEVWALLKETADALNVGDISMDMNLSSIQLLQSVIHEAGRRLGFSDYTWAKQLVRSNDSNVTLGAGDTDNTLANSLHLTGIDIGPHANI